MIEAGMKYHEAALGYIEKYYQLTTDENFFFGFPFINNLADEAKKIALAEGLTDQEYEKAVLAVVFRYAGVTDIFNEDDSKFKLLQDFASQVAYPENELHSVITLIKNNIKLLLPQTRQEKVVWDAVNSRFAVDDLITRASFLKEEINRINGTTYSEFEILDAFKEELLKSTFLTEYGKTHYTDKKDKNFVRLDKRIQKLLLTEKKIIQPKNSFSDKETEDLFKIAFRNYSHLVGVADTKAHLLINVNSIIISVIIAFVVKETTKYPFFTIPSFILLTSAFITLVLSILASKPSRNKLIQDKTSKSYQTFFFGSLDLIGREFFKVSWPEYSAELDNLLKGGKEKVYEEMYKEAFNVRKVLARKFTFLSIAYWVFMSGLLISIVTFFIQISH